MEHKCRRFLGDSPGISPHLPRHHYCKRPATRVAFGNSSIATANFYCEDHAPSDAIDVYCYEHAQRMLGESLARSRVRVSDSAVRKLWKVALKSV